MAKAASSLRPHIVQVMAARQGRILSTEEIYAPVAALGGGRFQPQREAGPEPGQYGTLGSGRLHHAGTQPPISPVDHQGQPRPLSVPRARPDDGRGAVEVYENRPARRRRVGNQRQNVPESMRIALYAAQRGVCPGCGFYQPHHLRFEVDHIVALSDDEEHEVRNLQLLCPYCNRVKRTQGSQGFRMKMTELRAHNAATGVMVDERETDLTGRRLAQYHLEGGNAAP